MTETETNERGNTVRRFFNPADRYLFDFKLCSAKDGWKQYDTEQDAHYFGVWVHTGRRQIVTYAEGDVSIVDCPTVEGFKVELAKMADFYGPPPPAFRVIHADGSRTHIFDPRPTAEEAQR